MSQENVETVRAIFDRTAQFQVIIKADYSALSSIAVSRLTVNMST